MLLAQSPLEPGEPAVTEAEKMLDGETVIAPKVTLALLKLLKRAVAVPLLMLVSTPTVWFPKATLLG
jgi:hypothetical protein